jgi:hypothetical protein
MDKIDNICSLSSLVYIRSEDEIPFVISWMLMSLRGWIQKDLSHKYFSHLSHRNVGKPLFY